MLTLLQSEKFREDYDRIQNRISQVENLETKATLTSLLTELVNEIKKVDTINQDAFAMKRPSALGQESRTKIIEIRKQIDRLLQQ